MVRGVVVLSDAETGQELAVIECASVTSLRTGGAAAVSAQVLAREDAATVGAIGCGVNGTWAARCLAAAGYGPGVCADPRAEAAEALAAELDWEVGDRKRAAGQDVVVAVTPGDSPVIATDDLRPGQHIAALGADAHGKAEVELAALASCHLFCDEWAQASAGGELAHAVDAGAVSHDDVTEIGDVMLGSADGRGSAEEVTCSTRPASRSRTWRSPRRSTRRGNGASSRPRWSSSKAQSTSVPSTRNATRTCARHSSRLSPRRPVETTSIARMFRSEL